MSNTIQIQPFNLKDASLAEYAALNRHTNAIRRERLPDDPAVPLEETIQQLKNIPPFVALKMWCTWVPGQTEIVAQSNVALMRTDENQHMAQFELTVQPEYRRRGLGRQLLTQVAEAAQTDNRRLLITETVDRIPAGEAWMTRLGAQKELEAHVNQLSLADLERGLVERWIAQANPLAGEFELGLWEGPYPEGQLAAVAQLMELVNQQPMGDLEIEDMHMTPEQLRQMEQMIFSRGYQRWTFYVTEKATGKFVGYTETAWNPNRPEVLRQDMTGVFPEYRKRGLGRWLKAAMIAKVLKERPEVKYIRTGNADTNAAMLKINHELGFKPYMASTLWQIELQHVFEYLNTKR
jgi:mycothiol synthase